MLLVFEANRSYPTAISHNETTHPKDLGGYAVT